MQQIRPLTRAFVQTQQFPYTLTFLKSTLLLAKKVLTASKIVTQIYAKSDVYYVHGLTKTGTVMCLMFGEDYILK